MTITSDSENQSEPVSNPNPETTSTINIPNLLTLFRIALLPVMAVCFLIPAEWGRPAAGWIFLLGALTDIFDGMLARRLNQSSDFGRFLDPVADKLQVAVALVLLTYAHHSLFVLVPAVLIIGREITVSALREWMAERAVNDLVAVSGWGKVKTVLQMWALTMMIYQENLFGILPTYDIGLILLQGALLLTLWSLWGYLRGAWPHLRGGAAGGA
ncbi:MAG: CDP-diacylglycerol--glycerol-3-phosphate 3-phosphatidyltransferase [Immundisolibacteraceae bacterium]|nr:CDP-diacylglycerol--glycerol-3-phosphate 3-phosphatidyltransferase [Immundisolibacteraceae bacterium]